MLKCILFRLGVFIAAVSSAFADSPRHCNQSLPPASDAIGGPDLFGYTWKDSQEPSGPVFQWLDIVSTGGIVEGLQDDNCVGPISFGFPFRFYWYDVESCYIGSNGYIQFGEAHNLAQPFPAAIPLPSLPNDFVAAYAADWNLNPLQGGAGEVYFWTNHRDSCVISFIEVAAFLIGGSHTFQIILTQSDSSITFQYGAQQGLIANNDILIGIESAAGFIGLEHSHDQYIQPNYAVKFYYPDSVGFPIYDLSAQKAVNDHSEGFFLLAGASLDPNGTVKNLGNLIVNSHIARFRIRQEGSGAVIYDLFLPRGAIPAGAEQTVTFPLLWSPPEEGQYFLTFSISFAGDMNAANDEKSVECRIVELPGVLQYDDGNVEMNWVWQGGVGGIAQRFVPPSYPVRLDTLYFFTQAGSSPFTAEILDDDGVAGAPGEVLYQIFVTAHAAGFQNVVTVPEEIVFYDGSFYIAWLMNDSLSPALGVDLSEGQIPSRQSWEYTGAWVPFRYSEAGDPMIRCAVSPAPWYPLPPVITAYSPADLDTVALDSTVHFWAQAQDLNNDSLIWRWLYDDLMIGQDTAVSVTFAEAGEHSVQVTVSDGEFADSLIWNVTVVSLGVMESRGRFADEFKILSVSPNPFNSSASIVFELPCAELIHIAVFDIAGRLLLKKQERRFAGRQTAVLDFEDFSSGIYIIRLSAGEYHAASKVVLLR